MYLQFFLPQQHGLTIFALHSHLRKCMFWEHLNHHHRTSSLARVKGLCTYKIILLKPPSKMQRKPLGHFGQEQLLEVISETWIQPKLPEHGTHTHTHRENIGVGHTRMWKVRLKIYDTAVAKIHGFCCTKENCLRNKRSFALSAGKWMKI